MMPKYKLNPSIKGDHVTRVDGVTVNLGTRKLSQTTTQNGVERTVEVLPATQDQLAKLFKQGYKTADGYHLIIMVEDAPTSTKK